MSSQPNVLLVSTDHWPAALLGVAGHAVIQTPALDELARSELGLVSPDEEFYQVVDSPGRD